MTTETNEKTIIMRDEQPAGYTYDVAITLNGVPMKAKRLKDGEFFTEQDDLNCNINTYDNLCDSIYRGVKLGKDVHDKGEWSVLGSSFSMRFTSLKSAKSYIDTILDA